MGSIRTALLTWDWREQPSTDRLARILTEVSGGTVHLAEVDTGDDQYALVFSNELITGEQATAMYHRRGEGEQ